MRPFILINFVCILGALSASPRSLEPNKYMIDSVVYVIDTIPAKELFLLIKPTIIHNIDKIRNKHTLLQTLLQSNRKWAKTDFEKAIVYDAFDYILDNPQLYYGDDISGERRQKDYYDVRKGKLTKTIRTILYLYGENHLTKKITALYDSLENNWTCFIDNPPTKPVTIQVVNPNYRGFHYDNYYKLNKIERDRLLGEYTYIFSNRGVEKKETYPTEVSYLQFPELPNYKVIDNYCMEIYNNTGNLVYVPILERQSDSSLLPDFISKEIMRLVYLKD